MSFLQKIQAIADALTTISTLIPQVQTALTNFDSFLDGLITPPSP